MRLRHALLTVTLVFAFIIIWSTVITAVFLGGDNSSIDYAPTQFQLDLSSLISEYSDLLDNPEEAKTNPYYSKRLLLRLKDGNIDFSKYGPVKVLHDENDPSYYIIQFDSEDKMREALEDLRTLRNIDYVDTDKIIELPTPDEEEVEPFKPVYRAPGEFLSWGAERIGADVFASSITNKDQVTVAVVDTGVASHPFINNNLISGGYDFIDSDTDTTDENSHGTHVAGIVVDCTPNLNVRILPVRVLNKNGFGYSSSLAEGIRYAADHGANVLNLSFGGGHTEEEDRAIDYALSKGVVVCAASGNEATNNADFCPAHLNNNTIVVSAIDKDDEKTIFNGWGSNWGESVDVAAPGVAINSTVLNGEYGLKSGTSMATPHVSAAAAMLLLANPGSSPAQIEELIRTSTRDAGADGKDSYYGYGILDLSKLVSDPDKEEPIPDNPVPNKPTPNKPNPNDDEDSKTSLYNNVIEKYISALKNRSTYDVEELGDFGGGDFFEAGLDGLGYSFYDINSDGTPELFLGNTNGEYFAAVYTIENNTVKQVVRQVGSDTFTALLSSVPGHPEYENCIVTLGEWGSDEAIYYIYKLNSNSLSRIASTADYSLIENNQKYLKMTPFSQYR